VERTVSGGPLAGVRVLDFGWTWAGPYCGMILTDLGADVIKIETSRRLDMLRLSGAFADGVRDHERSGWYAATNRGKRSITIDMKHPEGRALVLDLAAISDAAIENFSPRVLPGLGLGFEDLSAVNPGIVLLSLSAYGATGPEHDYVAYGDHLGYASGLASIIGHPDDGPTPINTFYGDPVGGMYGALAILAAIDERDRTGLGRHLEYSQVEGLLTMMPGPIIKQSSGEPVERFVDKSPTMAPHGFYRCAGDDAWVAIAVEDDERWSAWRALALDAGVEVADLATLEARKADEAALDAAVSAWTAPLSPWQVTAACQAIGVAAYPLMDSARLMRDAHLHERDFLSWVTHPIAGPGPVPGVVFRIGDDGARVRGPAPTMGQHNEEVFMRLLGLSQARYEQLVADGAIA
jgi:crotonobetainyl-CoA:carnitine CoA-transferase CaiB-like acyl-CoA transferase